MKVKFSRRFRAIVHIALALVLLWMAYSKFEFLDADRVSTVAWIALFVCAALGLLWEAFRILVKNADPPVNRR